MKMQKVQEKVMAAAGALQQNKIMNLISKSMMKLMPVLMTGAICSLINGLPLGEGYTNFLANTGLSTLLSAATTISQLMALWVALSMGAGVAEMWDEDKTTCSAVGVLTFLLCTPLNMTVTAESGEIVNVANVLSTTDLGAKGMFAAMIVSALSSSLYCWLMSKNLKIKLPESVPEFVSKSFESIIPAIIVGVVFIAVRGIFELTPWGGLNTAIYEIIQTPLSKLGGTLPTMLLFIFLTSLLWWFGLHGTLILLPIARVLYMPQMTTNLEAFMAGAPLEPTSIVVLSYLFWYLFIQFFGGPGMLLGLDINMLLFGKSERYKALGKLAAVPGLFNIIEPVVYGFPVVMNPILLIPFCVGPVIYAIIGYFLMTAGIVGYPVVQITVMTMPSPIVGFLLGGGISLGIFMLVGILFSTVMYYPFFKVADKLALKEEQGNE